MKKCAACSGFVPASSSVCPNCGTKHEGGVSIGKNVMRAAVAIGASMTLMACYGGAVTDCHDYDPDYTGKCGYGGESTGGSASGGNSTGGFNSTGGKASGGEGGLGGEGGAGGAGGAGGESP